MTTSSSSYRSRRSGVLSATAAAALALLASAARAPTASAQWVVETNSLRILEPSSVAGRHDAAIGDVSKVFVFLLVLCYRSSFSSSHVSSQPLPFLPLSNTVRRPALRRHPGGRDPPRRSRRLQAFPERSRREAQERLFLFESGHRAGRQGGLLLHREGLERREGRGGGADRGRRPGRGAGDDG